MYERLLDKQHPPTGDEFLSHCGQSRPLLEQLDHFLLQAPGCQKLLRFPYGNSYGWSYKYSVKTKLICDLFAEKDAFTVMLRLTDAQFAAPYPTLSDCGKKYVDKKYPCGGGGWIHYRVVTAQHLADVQKLLGQKVGFGG